MQQKVLYRGKTRSGHWVEGSLVMSKQGDMFIIGINDEPIEKSVKDWWIKAPAYEIDPKTKGQLLFSLYGHRFFEGDIIGRDKSNAKYVILWNEVNQCFSTFNSYDLKNVNEGDELLKLNTLCNMEQVRVSFLNKYNFYPVGNIHDNKAMMSIQ